jgi:hypothetical protein
VARYYYLTVQYRISITKWKDSAPLDSPVAPISKRNFTPRTLEATKEGFLPSPTCHGYSSKRSHHRQMLRLRPR